MNNSIKIIKVNGRKHIMINVKHKDAKCYFCGALFKDIDFQWLIFHGRAESSCCGAIYQLKDYYIEKPNEEQKKLLEMLKGYYIEFDVKPDWIEPLKEAMKQTGIKNMNNDEVIELAKKIMGDKELNNG